MILLFNDKNGLRVLDASLIKNWFVTSEGDLEGEEPGIDGGAYTIPDIKEDKRSVVVQTLADIMVSEKLGHPISALATASSFASAELCIKGVHSPFDLRQYQEKKQEVM